MAKHKVKITETYTYEIVLDIADNETLDDVVHETEPVRFMSDEMYEKTNFSFEYEEV